MKAEGESSNAPSTVIANPLSNVIANPVPTVIANPVPTVIANPEWGEATQAHVANSASVSPGTTPGQYALAAIEMSNLLHYLCFSPGKPWNLVRLQRRLVRITLPSSSARQCLLLDDGKGRDQVVTRVRADWSAFERPLPAILHACAARSPGLVIDAGANTGYYALLAAAAHSASRVMAFEPDRAVRPLLRRNVAANKFRSRIFISVHALSDSAGTAQLYVPTQEHGLVETSSSLEKSFKTAHSEVRTISVTSLDAYLRRPIPRLLAGSRKITLLKIDEGHEAAVLRGASGAISRDRPLIFIEILPNAEMSFLSRFIEENAYVDIPLSPGELTTRDAVAFVEGAWNHAFVPREDAASFLNIARAATAD